MLLRCRIAGFVLAVAFPAHAVQLQVSHPYGELVDQGSASVRLSASPDAWFDCALSPRVEVAPGLVRLAMRTASYPSGPVPECASTRIVDAGVLAAGWWRFEANVERADGALVDTVAVETMVVAPETQCNRYPLAGNSTVTVTHAMLGATAFVQRFESDPAFRALLGDPIEVRPLTAFDDVILGYPVLQNPHDLRARLLATGEFRQAHAQTFLCLALAPPDRFANAVEYYHAGLDNYFYTLDPREMTGLDDGTGAQGWRRTGHSFRVLSAPGCLLGVPEGVAYRFFGKPGAGPSSHVFTVDRQECRSVERSGAWLYEGVAFWAVPLDARGGCGDPGRIPLYRAWRPFGESSHRFTTDRAVVEAMKQQGWIDEGVSMCVRAPG